MAILNNLIVHGSSRFLNIAQFNALKTNTIGADKGVFNKLIATDATFDSLDVEDLTAQNATVVGLLDVQGDMHTNSWSNSNIATIDGSFYITPTAVSADGADVTVSGYTPTGAITYSNTNYTQMTITGTFDTSQLTLDSTSAIAWPANSYVIVTGDVLVGTEWYPLGTIRGKLSAQVAANTNSKTFTIIPIGTQIISGESGNVSLTDGNGHKPSTLEAIRTAGATLSSLKLRKVKISMTSRGNGNDQYALGIYMTAMGGNKKTFLDIYGGNNKNGVDISSTISGITYQSGAFAKPTVRIGNLLGLPPFTLPNNTSVTPTGWGIYTTNGFFSGTIVSTQGKIGNFTLGTAIYGAASGAGPSSISATTAGTYLGTDGFRSNKSGDTTKYVQITDGIITAKGADITGAVNATSFTASYTNGSVTYNTLLDGNGLVVTDGSNNTLSKFGAISTIGRDNGNNYNINITGTAIDLRYNTSILNRINNAGMTIYNTNKYQIAKFGQETVLGTIIPNNFYTKVNSSGITIYHTVDDNAVPVWNSSNSCYEYPDLISVSYAQFGNTSRIGYEDRAHITIDSTSYKQYGVDGNNDLFISLEDLRDPDFLVANIVETFTDRSSSFLDLLFEISTVSSSGMLTTYHLPQVTKNGVTLTYDTDFSISSDSKRRLIFTNLISSADIIEVNYFTNDKMAKSFTLGKRNETAISGPYSFVIGYNNKATGFLSYAEGSSTTASGESSHAEGHNATASGSVSHAEGFYTTASGSYSHAEGHHATASGSVSHAEGYYSTASGTYSHAEGLYAVASNAHSHAEGHHARASGSASHAEGYYSTARGSYSHAEGNYTTAQGTYSHAQNLFTVATENSQTVIGKYNSAIRSGSGTTADPYTYSDAGDYAFIIGNGTDDATAARSNALTVDWNGNVIGQAMAGIIQMYAGAAAQQVNASGIITGFATGCPSGWLVCDGSEALITDYPELNNALGGDSANGTAATLWGTATNTGCFKLPDLRGRAPIGVNPQAITGISARALGNTLGHEAMQKHLHGMNHTHGTGDSDAGMFNIHKGNGMSRHTVYGGSGTNRGYQWTTDSTSSSAAVTHRSATGAPSSTTTGYSGTGEAGNMQPSAVVNFIICTGKTS